MAIRMARIAASGADHQIAGMPHCIGIDHVAGTAAASSAAPAVIAPKARSRQESESFFIQTTYIIMLPVQNLNRRSGNTHSISRTRNSGENLPPGQKNFAAAFIPGKSYSVLK